MLYAGDTGWEIGLEADGGMGLSGVASARETGKSMLELTSVREALPDGFELNEYSGDSLSTPSFIIGNFPLFDKDKNLVGCGVAGRRETIIIGTVAPALG